mmetsp:Transcript_11517/g.48365  ORF Transcript_11517/g.48365 Transcript_11517/m.48365 type:complete len:209 (-) Transcript_11517:1044-1670(-)
MRHRLRPSRSQWTPWRLWGHCAPAKDPMCLRVVRAGRSKCRLVSCRCRNTYTVAQTMMRSSPRRTLRWQAPQHSCGALVLERAGCERCARRCVRGGSCGWTHHAARAVVPGVGQTLGCRCVGVVSWMSLKSRRSSARSGYASTRHSCRAWRGCSSAWQQLQAVQLAPQTVIKKPRRRLHARIVARMEMKATTRVAALADLRPRCRSLP